MVPAPRTAIVSALVAIFSARHLREFSLSFILSPVAGERKGEGVEKGNDA
jgi:hypothetical protein